MRLSFRVHVFALVPALTGHVLGVVDGRTRQRLQSGLSRHLFGERGVLRENEKTGKVVDVSMVCFFLCLKALYV